MSVQVNHSVTGLDPLTDAIQTLIAKLDSMGSNLNNSPFTNDKAPDVDMGAGINKGMPGANADPFNKMNEPMARMAQSLNSWGSKIDDLIRQFKTMNDNIEKANSGGGGGDSDDSGTPRRRGRNRRLMYEGLLIGAATAGIYEAGTWGQTEGSASGSLSSGFLNYADFQKELSNRKLSNLQSNVSSGLSMATIAAAIANPYLGLGMAGVSMVGNYMFGDYSETQKNLNDQNRQDTIAWRMNNMHMGGGMSNQIIRDNIRLTNVQSGSLTDQYGLYDRTLSDTMFGGRRDSINSMSNNQNLEFNKSLNMLGMLSGNGNISQLSSTSTNLAAMLGISPNEAANKMIEDISKYGGDTASNTSKMIQILQTTATPAKVAEDATLRYQFNDPMLQNTIAQYNQTPSSNFAANVLAQIGTLSDSEMSGGLEGQHRDQYISDITSKGLSRNLAIDEIRSRYYQTKRMNPLANHLGDINPNESGVGDMSRTALQQQQNDQVISTLRQLTITGDQSIEIKGNVTFTGNAGQNLWNDSRPSSKGIPHTGASQPVIPGTNTPLYVVHHGSH